MATKIYLPTKADQEETNKKIDDLLKHIEDLQSSASIPTANVTVRLNWKNQTFDVPTDTTEISEILKDAQVILTVPGVDTPYTAAITSLNDFACVFKVQINNAALVNPSTVAVKFGSSKTTAYACLPKEIYLSAGASETVNVNSIKIAGENVEVFRAQPYSKDPENDKDQRLKAGNSYLGIKVTTASGTKIHFGHWTKNQEKWIDESYTRVSIWDVPKNNDGTAGTPVERIISDTDTTSWISLDDRLNAIKNIKIGTMSYTDGTTTVGDNKMVRYDQLWVKTTKETLNMPIENDDGTLKDNNVECVVKWYANSNVDGTYHLHPLFETYIRQADGSYATKTCKYGYIARYLIGNVTDITIDGQKVSAPQWKAGNNVDYVPGTRSDTLAVCRRLNKVTSTLTFDGEDPITINPDSTNRTWGVAGTAEISFIQWMAYLYFGVNVQGAANSNDFSQNIFPGICDSDSGTTNGDTDFIVNVGKMSGAINTRSTKNSIVFLGVEDAIWSCYGWYWEDLTNVNRTIYTTDADGKVTITRSGNYLFAQDPADVEPGATDNQNELYANSEDNKSYEAKLKAAGYREVAFPEKITNDWWYRAGVDSSSVLRDAYLPGENQDQANLNIGGCDYANIADYDSNIGTFSDKSSYSVGKYVIYEGKLYKCIVEHKGTSSTPLAWDATHFTIVVNETLTLRNYWLVRLNAYRYNSSFRGSFYVASYNDLTYVFGYSCRARPFLRVVS